MIPTRIVPEMGSFATLLLLSILQLAALVHGQVCGRGSKHTDVHFRSWGLGGLLEGRIVGGVVAQPNEWPWQVSLLTNNGGGMQHWCGGALIGKQLVLTAAHCVKNSLATAPNPSSWIVKLGEHYMQSIDASELSMAIKRITPYPLYDKFDNDVAVLKLNTPVQLNPNIQPICLPKPGMDFTNAKCVATGWGKLDGSGYSKTSNVLHEVELQIFDNSVCDNAYRTQHQIPIREWHLCAGTNNGRKGTCQGDSGGPLQCLHKTQWYVVGVTSFGSGCAKPGFPDVFSRVSHFASWIRQNA